MNLAEADKEYQGLRMQSARLASRVSPLLVASEAVQEYMTINARLQSLVDNLTEELKNEREKSESSKSPG